MVDRESVGVTAFWGAKTLRAAVEPRIGWLLAEKQPIVSLLESELVIDLSLNSEYPSVASMGTQLVTRRRVLSTRFTICGAAEGSNNQTKGCFATCAGRAPSDRNQVATIALRFHGKGARSAADAPAV